VRRWNVGDGTVTKVTIVSSQRRSLTSLTFEDFRNGKVGWLRR
jgi:hypothetical protein